MICTMIFQTVSNPIETAEILNNDLEIISTWVKTWQVTFNATKTESILFTRKHIDQHHPNLYFNGVQIAKLDSHKHLGITLQSDGHWNEHVKSIIKKTNQKLVIMRKLKFLLDRRIFYVRPILGYGNMVWININDELQNNLEQTQLEAARIVTEGIKGTHRDQLYKETN